MPQTSLNRRLLRIEYRGRTIAAADSLHEIAEAFWLFRPRAFFICDVVVDTRRGECDDARIWGRILGHPNGMLSVEARPIMSPSPRTARSLALYLMDISSLRLGRKSPGGS